MAQKKNTTRLRCTSQLKKHHIPLPKKIRLWMAVLLAAACLAVVQAGVAVVDDPPVDPSLLGGGDWSFWLAFDKGGWSEKSHKVDRPSFECLGK